MKVTVRCFASVREALGDDRLEIEIPEGSTIDDLFRVLVERSPELEKLPLVRAVNRAYADGETALNEGDEVAFVPPISGGSRAGEDLLRFDFHQEPLDPRSLEAFCRTDRDGAVVTFAGVTRNHHEGQDVTGLAYEAYEEMAREVALRILDEVRTKHGVGRCAVAHRLGEVPIGEASILVVVASAHRVETFDAAREIMDRIKREVPIFKREFLVGGGDHWVGELPVVDD